MSILDCKRVIEEGDHVLLYQSHDKITSVVVKRGETAHNTLGAFSHDSIIGATFGSKIFGKGKASQSWVVALHPTPELWTNALSHRTQILYVMDIAMITSHLQLRPGSVVVESGTGSGSLSTSMARSIAPHGHLFTFEFNADRVEKARADFTRNGLSNLITVTHRDVCSRGFPKIEGGVDAVFLDLPNPWVVIQSCASILVPQGILCSFSPCIEQVQRTCAALSEHGFTTIRTFESLWRTFDVKRDRPEVLNLNPTAPSASGDQEEKAATKDAATEGANRKRSRNEQNSEVAITSIDSQTFAKPFPEMRGHTGYLTFAVRSASTSS